MKELRESVIATLAYFDIFDHPLTSEEMYRFLLGTCTGYADFIMYLDALLATGVCGRKYGYYYLPGREKIIEVRRRRALIREEKMHIARRGIKKLRCVPFVRAVFVCNTTAIGIPEKESDVDVFVVVKKGWLWLARFLIITVLQIFKMRIEENHAADKLCLSFYAADAHLDMSAVRLDENDIYLAYWIHHLIPVYDPGGVFSNVIRANVWTRRIVPHAAEEYMLHPRWRVLDTVYSRTVRRLGEAVCSCGFGRALQRRFKAMQMKRLDRNFGALIKYPDSRVVVSDDMLKFHDNDRRAQFRRQWRAVCRVYGVDG